MGLMESLLEKGSIKTEGDQHIKQKVLAGP